MFVFIDVKFNQNPRTFRDLHIEGINTLITDFKDFHHFKYTLAKDILDIKDDIENNLIISCCCKFEIKYLNKCGIYPNIYIDLNYVLKIENFRCCCNLFGIPFDPKNVPVCTIMYELVIANFDKMIKTLEKMDRKIDKNKYQENKSISNTIH